MERKGPKYKLVSKIEQTQKLTRIKGKMCVDVCVCVCAYKIPTL